MDQGRFLSLFLKHRRELAGFVRACLPDWNGVDDILQDSSLVLWQKIDQLSADEDFLRWAKVVLRFEVLKYRRSISRDRLVFDEDLIQMIINESVNEHDEHSFRRQDAFRQCFSEFSEANRKLLLRPYVEHGGVKELAAAEGLSANALYKRLVRLRKILQDCTVERLRVTG